MTERLDQEVAAARAVLHPTDGPLNALGSRLAAIELEVAYLRLRLDLVVALLDGEK